MQLACSSFDFLGVAIVYYYRLVDCVGQNMECKFQALFQGKVKGQSCAAASEITAVSTVKSAAAVVADL